MALRVESFRETRPSDFPISSVFNIDSNQRNAGMRALRPVNLSSGPATKPQLICMFTTGNAPSWLFSFVDLAFLLLIALTQINARSAAETVDLGEITLPRVHSATVEPVESGTAQRWQVRIHPPNADEMGPYALVHAVSGEPGAEAELTRFDAEGLELRLAALFSGRAGRPLLAPHGNARVSDMLDAVGLVEEFWPQDRRTAVIPVAARW